LVPLMDIPPRFLWVDSHWRHHTGSKTNLWPEPNQA